MPKSSMKKVSLVFHFIILYCTWIRITYTYYDKIHNKYYKRVRLGEKILSHIFRQKLDYFSVKYFRSSFISCLLKNCKAHFFIVFPRERRYPLLAISAVDILMTNDGRTMGARSVMPFSGDNDHFLDDDFFLSIFSCLHGLTRPK